MTPPAAAADPLPQPAWGGLLAVYFILIGIPSGITLMCFWLRQRGTTGGGEALERYGHWTALAALGAAGLILVVDLGRPERFYLMLTRFDNLGSPIAVGAKLIAIKMVLLAIVVYLMERSRDAKASGRTAGERLGAVLTAALPWLLAMCSLALAIYPASVLARSWASPLTATSAASLIFLITALLMGAATAILIVGAKGSERAPEILHTSRRVLLALLGLLGMVLVFEALSLGGNPPDRRILADVVTGGFAATFWGLVVGVGMALPAVGLSLFPTRRAVLAVSAAAAMAGAAAARYLIFAAG